MADVETLTGSIWQIAEQPSPPTRLPSSHCSPSAVSMMPSPHVVVQTDPRMQRPVGSPPVFIQVALHIAPLSALHGPGTHLPGSSEQLLAQPSPSATFPSSHCSPLSTTPLPQWSRQAEPSAHTPSGGPPIFAHA